MIIRAAFCLVLGLYGTALAKEDSVLKYRNYLPQEIIQMPEADRSSSVPMMYVIAANKATSVRGDLLLKYYLNSLMYNGLTDFINAKKAFQSDLGEEPTGDLTVWQINTLNFRSDRSKLTGVGFFFSDFGGSISDDQASVKGTVKILDDKIGFPINHVNVECSRSSGTCDYRQTVLIIPDENSWSQSYNIRQFTTDTYRIVRWENNQIDAVPILNNGCRTNQLSFNFTTGEFFEIVRNNTLGECKSLLGVTIPRLDEPRVSQIVNGDEIIDAEFQKISEEVYLYISSDFRAQLNKLKVD
jgi:hypothetical protein